MPIKQQLNSLYQSFALTLPAAEKMRSNSRLPAINKDSAVKDGSNNSSRWQQNLRAVAHSVHLQSDAAVVVHSASDQAQIMLAAQTLWNACAEDLHALTTTIEPSPLISVSQSVADNLLEQLSIHLSNPESSPFKAAKDRTALVNVLAALSPTSALAADIKVRLTQQPAFAKKFIGLLQCYVDKIAHGRQTENQIVRHALTLFPPVHHDYQLEQLTMQKLVAAIDTLDGGPLRLLRCVYASKLNHVLPKSTRILPFEQQVKQLPPAFHRALYARATSIDLELHRWVLPLEGMEPKAVWQLYRSLHEVVLRLHTTVDTMAASVENFKHVAPAEEVRLFTPWNLSAWAEIDRKGESVSQYQTSNDYKQALYAQLNQLPAIKQSGLSSIDWQRLDTNLMPKLPNYEELFSQRGVEWILNNLTTARSDQFASTCREAALQALYLLVKDPSKGVSYSYEVVYALGDQNSMARGFAYLEQLMPNKKLLESIHEFVDEAKAGLEIVYRYIYPHSNIDKDAFAIEYIRLVNQQIPLSNFLNEHYVHPNPDSEGITLADSMAHSGLVDGLKPWLLNASIETINRASPDGRTLLYRASQSGHSELVSLLMSRGAILTPLKHNGYTAIHIAAENGHDAVVRAICMAFEAPETMNAPKTKPQESYYDHDFKPTPVVVPFLNKKAASGNQPIHIAVRAGHSKVVEVLAQHHADLEVYGGAHHLTPTMSAVHYKQWKVLEVLLKNGADPAHGSYDSHFQPVELAYENRDYKSLTILMQHNEECSEWVRNTMSSILLLDECCSDDLQA